VLSSDKVPGLIRGDNAFGHTAWTQTCQARRESPNPWEVKVGAGVLPGSKHTKLRCIRDEQWVQMRCLNLSMLGLGCALEPEYVRLGCRSSSTLGSDVEARAHWHAGVHAEHQRCWACHAHVGRAPCKGSSFLPEPRLLVWWARDTKPELKECSCYAYFERIFGSILEGFLDSFYLYQSKWIFWDKQGQSCLYLV
jgi:hypothetical protein